MFHENNLIKLRFQQVLYTKKVSSSQKLPRTILPRSFLMSLKFLKRILMLIWITTIFSKHSFRPATRLRILLKTNMVINGPILKKELHRKCRKKTIDQYDSESDLVSF